MSSSQGNFPDNPQVSVDKAKISENLHIPQDIYERIVKNAFSPTDRDLIDLEKGIAASDFETVHRLAHRLKGTYGNLRITYLGEIAKQINDLSTAKGDSKAMMDLLNQFKKYYEQLKNYF